VTFLRHSESPFRAVRPSKILSITRVQFYGGRSNWLELNGLTSITDAQAESLSKVEKLWISGDLQPLIDESMKE
jgi:hypothetical protein